MLFYSAWFFLLEQPDCFTFKVSLELYVQQGMIY